MVPSQINPGFYQEICTGVSRNKHEKEQSVLLCIAVEIDCTVQSVSNICGKALGFLKLFSCHEKGRRANETQQLFANKYFFVSKEMACICTDVFCICKAALASIRLHHKLHLELSRTYLKIFLGFLYSNPTRNRCLKAGIRISKK